MLFTLSCTSRYTLISFSFSNKPSIRSTSDVKRMGVVARTFSSIDVIVSVRPKRSSWNGRRSREICRTSVSAAVVVSVICAINCRAFGDNSSSCSASYFSNLSIIAYYAGDVKVAAG